MRNLFMILCILQQIWFACHSFQFIYWEERSARWQAKLSSQIFLCTYYSKSLGLSHVIAWSPPCNKDCGPRFPKKQKRKKKKATSPLKSSPFSPFCLDPSVLAFSLSLYRHPSIFILFRFRFTSWDKQTNYDTQWRWWNLKMNTKNVQLSQSVEEIQLGKETRVGERRERKKWERGMWWRDV